MHKCIGVNANLELVDKSCYLGDMLSVDGDADAAVENRIFQAVITAHVMSTGRKEIIFIYNQYHWIHKLCSADLHQVQVERMEHAAGQLLGLESLLGAPLPTAGPGTRPGHSL